MTDRKGFPGFIRSVLRKTVRALYKRAGYFCLFLRAHRFHPFLGLSLRRSFRMRPEVALHFLADDIIVAANAVVDKSFEEPDIVVGGIPAKKISDKGFKDRKIV